MNNNLESENIVEENHQKFESNWDEESLAKLLGYDEDKNPNHQTEVTETETISEYEPTNNVEFQESDIEVSNENNNVIDQGELFDSPHDGKTQPTFATNPFAKFGAVGLILLVVFGTGATFLNTIISGQPKAAPKISAQNFDKPKVILREDTKPNEVENGKLKAELALSTQAEKIKSQEESKNTKTPIPQSNSQTKSELNNQKVNTAQPERPTIISRPPVYTSMPRPVRQNSYPIPRYYPEPRASVPERIQTAIKPNPSLIPSPVRRISPPTLVKPDVIDPTEQWVAVNQLGSYGTAEIATKNEQQTIEEIKPVLHEEPVPTTIPKAIPLMVSSQTTVYPEPLYTEEARILNEDTNTLIGQEDDSHLDCTNSLNNLYCPKSQIGALKIGETMNGKLLTPLIWDTNNANPEQQNFNQKENFIVQITEPLKDKNGLITLPKNTQIITTIKNIQESGLVQLEAAQIIINGKQYILPQQVISIRGNSGLPLMASQRGSKNENIAARDAETFVVGSLSKVGKVLNQPKSEQFSTSSGFGGNSSFSSIRRGNSNTLGAVLEGGFEPLTEQIVERNKRKSSEIERRKKVWYVPANTDVQIFVNQSFTLRDQ
ncbi:MAG: conjugal transfer protein TrbI [Rivularia sp. T60_A2020_040]|nr:conjugal transfer protein TrbI [Rivularia sp. T60_A2020_040]